MELRALVRVDVGKKHGFFYSGVEDLLRYPFKRILIIQRGDLERARRNYQKRRAEIDIRLAIVVS